MGKKVPLYPLNKNEQELFDKYQDLVKDIQSTVIEKANIINISLESHITFELAKKGRENFFKGAILDGGFFNFDDKIRLFELIQQKYHPEFLQNNPKVMKQLRKLRNIRNQFAHYLPNANIDEFEAAKKNQLHLKYFDKFTLKEVVYSLPELRKNLAEFNELSHTIIEHGKKLTN